MLKFNPDCCDAVAGNTRAGKFLHKLVFWLNSPNAPIFDGHRWVAFTHERWAKNTGLTVDQIRRILTALGAAKLIIREQHKYGGKVPNFIRLSAKCIDALCAAQVAQKCAAQPAQKSAALYKSEDINEGDKKTADGFAAASPETICLSGKKSYPEEVGSEIAFPVFGQGGPIMPTSAEIAAGVNAKWSTKTPLDTMKPDSAHTLVHVWQSSGKLVPGFTKKELGQLKHLIAKWPEGKAPEILAFALANWFEVTEAAETHADAFKSPSSPTIGYLVKYQHVAVNLWLKSKMKKPAPAPAPKPVVQSIAKPAEPLEDDKPMTWEELQAMEAEEELKAAS